MWAGPDSAQKGWADLSPTVLSASLAGLGQKVKTGRGIISPLPSSCMQNDI